MLNKPISLKLLRDLENNIIITEYLQYIEYCKLQDYINSTQFLLNITIKGFSVIDILDSLVIYIKYYDTSLSEENKFKIIKIILKYINIFYDLHEDKIELIFMTNNIIDIFK